MKINQSECIVFEDSYWFRYQEIISKKLQNPQCWPDPPKSGKIVTRPDPTRPDPTRPAGPSDPWKTLPHCIILHCKTVTTQWTATAPQLVAQTHNKYTANAPQMRRKCAANALQMHLKWTANAPQMHLKCTANASRMHRECTANAPHTGRGIAWMLRKAGVGWWKGNCGFVWYQNRWTNSCYEGVGWGGYTCSLVVIGVLLSYIVQRGFVPVFLIVPYIVTTEFVNVAYTTRETWSKSHVLRSHPLHQRFNGYFC